MSGFLEDDIVIGRRVKIELCLPISPTTIRSLWMAAPSFITVIM